MNSKELLRVTLRKAVNEIFEDIDNDALIDVTTANAICSIHTDKLYALFLQTEEETVKAVIGLPEPVTIPERPNHANLINVDRNMLRKEQLEIYSQIRKARE